MKKSYKNPLLDKSFEYAVCVVNSTKKLRKKDIDPAIISQFVRSSTSIGANIEEAVGGSSKRDFSNKLSIAYKESRESNFWIRVLNKTNFMDDQTYKKLYSINTEIQKMLFASIIKTQNRLKLGILFIFILSSLFFIA